MRRLIILVVLLALSTGVRSDGCNTLSQLEHLLYETGDNVLKLTQTFSPVEYRTSRQVRVIYNFEGNDTINDCSVKYFWALGGFLLVQPPSIFRFTSLLFSFPSNEIDDMFLTLPSECYHLVWNETTQNCSCAKESLLDVLTHHLLQYAKYNVPDQVIRDEKSGVRTVCDENLQKKYNNSNIKYFMVLNFLLLPLTVLFLLTLYLFEYLFEYRPKYSETSNIIETIVSNKSHHLNMVGLSITGMYITIYILIMDICACAFLGKNDEYKDYEEISNSFFYTAVIATCFFDVSITLIVTVISFIISVCPCCCCCQEKCDIKENHQWYFVISNLSLIPTIWCISSHLCYILLAWITEPEKTTYIALIAIAILLYFFISSKKIYNFFGKLWKKIKNKKRVDYKNLSGGDNDFNCLLYIIVSIVSLLLFIPIVLVTVGLYFLPILALELADYIEHIVEIILVIVAALIAYKVLSYGDPNESKFLKEFIKAYKIDEDSKINNSDEFQQSGKIIGMVCRALQNSNLSKNNSSEDNSNKRISSEDKGDNANGDEKSKDDRCRSI